MCLIGSHAHSANDTSRYYRVALSNILLKGPFTIVVAVKLIVVTLAVVAVVLVDTIIIVAVLAV